MTPIAASAYRTAFADPLHGHCPSVLPTARRPLSLTAGGKLLSTRLLAGGRAVYVGYNAVVAPSPAVVSKIGRLARGPKVRRVIVDVRRNGGGDNTTYGPLTSLFSSKGVNRRGRLYLLIARATFSAAGNFSAEIDTYTRAIFVGEPTTSGLNVHIAAEFHSPQRGPKDRRLAIAPDVRIEPSSKDYFARRDPVLDRALRGLGRSSDLYDRAVRRVGLHHLDIVVSSLERSLPLYRDLLRPLGYVEAYEVVGERGEAVWYLDGEGVGASLGIREAQASGGHDRYALGLHHLAFEASSREMVDERFRWARDQGLEIENEPREWPYVPGYYATFFHDHDGIKLEVVFVP